MEITSELILKFKQDFNEFATDTFRLFEPFLFYSLVIKNCNAAGPWTFSHATIDFTHTEHCFPVFMWYRNVFKNIIQEFSHVDSLETLKGKKTIRKLVDAYASMSCKHTKCLKQLLEVDQLTAEKIKCILALHYFKPLSADGDYIVDRCPIHWKCLLCNEEIKADPKLTSFGNNAVWHGQSDILVDKSIVKIHTDEPNDLSTEDLDGDLDVSHSSKIVEENRRSICQAIAQTVVNAFVESSKDKSVFNKFIPSYLATEKIIRIMIYNCKLDKLLVSGELPIFERDGRLCIRTMMFIWITMNSYVNEMDDTVQCLLEKTADSKFKDLVGDAYEFYLKDVTRPMTKSINKTCPLSQTFLQIVPKNDKEYIYEVGVEMLEYFKQLQN